MRKLKVAFRDLVNAPKDVSSKLWGFYNAVPRISFFFLGNDAASLVNQLPTIRTDKLPFYS